jgi:hypothetical protein
MEAGQTTMTRDGRFSNAQFFTLTAFQLVVGAIRANKIVVFGGNGRCRFFQTLFTTTSFAFVKCKTDEQSICGFIIITGIETAS